jgi:hypothetical protein
VIPLSPLISRFHQAERPTNRQQDDGVPGGDGVEEQDRDDSFDRAGGIMDRRRSGIGRRLLSRRATSRRSLALMSMQTLERSLRLCLVHPDSMDHAPLLNQFGMDVKTPSPCLGDLGCPQAALDRGSAVDLVQPPINIRAGS